MRALEDTRKMTLNELKKIKFSATRVVVNESIFKKYENDRDLMLCDEDEKYDPDVRFYSKVYGHASLESECGLLIEFSWLDIAEDYRTYTSAFDFTIYPYRELDEYGDTDIEIYYCDIINDQHVEGELMDDDEFWCVQNHALLSVIRNSDWQSAIDKVLPQAEWTDVDDGADLSQVPPGFESRCVDRNDDSSLLFYGKILAEVSNEYWPGAPWKELRLYRTIDDRYICERIRGSGASFEFIRYSAAICENIE
ncbi:hypothetical protein ACFFJ7_18845 [Pseudochelatococcus lubricantis]|uniref:hypothetical protein n=1 Tax=Pseudochelatococcus lubricantis TaxID=1538102 RepID=UPI0035EDD449